MEKSQNNQKKGDKCLKAAMERMKVLRSKTFAFLFFFFLQLRRKRRKRVFTREDTLKEGSCRSYSEEKLA